MPIGPGKYDDLCTSVREQAGGCAVVIIIGGKHGSGFSCQADLATTLVLPEMLEAVARQLRVSQFPDVGAVDGDADGPGG